MIPRWVAFCVLISDVFISIIHLGLFIFAGVQFLGPSNSSLGLDGYKTATTWVFILIAIVMLVDWFICFILARGITKSSKVLCYIWIAIRADALQFYVLAIIFSLIMTGHHSESAGVLVCGIGTNIGYICVRVISILLIGKFAHELKPQALEQGKDQIHSP